MQYCKHYNIQKRKLKHIKTKILVRRKGIFLFGSKPAVDFPCYLNRWKNSFTFSSRYLDSTYSTSSSQRNHSTSCSGRSIDIITNVRHSNQQKKNKIQNKSPFKSNNWDVNIWGSCMNSKGKVTKQSIKTKAIDTRNIKR